MVSLRFQRIGRKKEAHFRLIAQEKTKDPHDKSLEILGFKNPRSKETELKTDRIKYWLSVGAVATPSVYNLLIAQKIIDDNKKAKAVKISKKRAAKIAETTKAEAPAKEETKEETPAEIESAPQETAPATEEVPAETLVEEEKSAEEKEA